MSAADSSSSERFTGRVKWFNNKAGYGFVTVSDGPKSGTDVFVHHSSIKVDSEQYKYLVQGEYVEFELLTTTGGAHEYQGGQVSGIKGGKLMCETRHDTRVTRTQYRPSKSEQEVVVDVQVRTPKAVTKPKRAPREDGEWSQVTRSKKPVKRSSDEAPRTK